MKDELNFTEKDWEFIIDLIDNPPSPNKALINLAKAYKAECKKRGVKFLTKGPYPFIEPKDDVIN